MAMQIKNTSNIILFSNFLDLLFNTQDLRMQQFIRILPISIQIKSSQITPKIPIDNTIDIHHRKYFENIFL